MKLKPSQGTTDGKSLWKDVLVVDTDLKTVDIVKRALPDGDAAIRAASTTDHAVVEMKRRPADLIVINLQVNDNHGLELLSCLRKRHPLTEVVAVSRAISADLAMAAWHAGAADLLVQPVDVKTIRASFKRLAENRCGGDRLLQRNIKLRTVCKKLNKARHEISQQVNLLCNDLVRAYQELAQQLNQTQTSGEFETHLAQEVEIETILRRTLEWVLEKIGPLNAAIFLPDSEGELSLGAYLNFDTEAETILIDTMSQTVGKTAQTATSPVIIETDEQLHQLYGEDAGLLLGRQWLAAPAFHQNECLAVVCLFRGKLGSSPAPAAQSEHHAPQDGTDEMMIQTLEMICPVLGDRIGRAIRIYQRGLQFDED